MSAHKVIDAVIDAVVHEVIDKVTDEAMHDAGGYRPQSTAISGREGARA